MPKVQTACPSCGQSVLVDINQVFDVGVDPQMKQNFLSGTFNFFQCQTCMHQGQLPLPLIYHDPEKELLLTFNPPDSRRTMEERENLLAPLLRQVTENLPKEKRKAYLFQPQTMLTMQNMFEKVLEADGITKEMLNAQEKKMTLIQRLLSISNEKQRELIRQNEDLIDAEFFMIFSRLAAMLPSDSKPEDVETFQTLQETILKETEFGRILKQRSEDLDAARFSLEQLGENLTREKLLILVLEAPNKGRVEALVRLARPGMDYMFIQMFTDKIEQTEDTEREKLIERRNMILRLTAEIDERIKEQVELARQNLEALLNADDIPQAITENINIIDDFFVQTVQEALNAAEKEDSTDRWDKLQQVRAVLEEIASPPEMKLIDEFSNYANDEAELKKIVAEHGVEITPRLIDFLTNLLGKVEESLALVQGEDKDQRQKLLENLNSIYQVVLLFSMEREMRNG